MTEVPDTATPPALGRLRGQVRLPAETSSGPAARRFALGHADDLDEDGRDTLALLVSEVVTNALLHARSGVTVRLSSAVDGAVLLVEVDDGGTAMPTMHDHGDGASTGRGMHLVDALSLRWGAYAGPAGKTVWFELPTARNAAG